HRMPLARAWEMPLERSLPVRRFTSRKGQRHLSGTVVVSHHRRPRGVRVLVGNAIMCCIWISTRPSASRRSRCGCTGPTRGGPCFCRTPLADQVHRVLARMALLDSTGGYLVGPHPEAGQCGGTEGVAQGDVGCVAAARDQYPADAWRVVARVEGVPLPAEEHLEPGREIHRLVVRRHT